MIEVEHEGRCPHCGAASSELPCTCREISAPGVAPPDIVSQARAATLGWVCVAALGLIGLVEAATDLVGLNPPSWSGLLALTWGAGVARLVAWMTTVAGAVTLWGGLRRHGRPVWSGLVLGGAGAACVIVTSLVATASLWFLAKEQGLPPALLSPTEWVIGFGHGALVPGLLLGLCVATWRAARGGFPTRPR